MTTDDLLTECLELGAGHDVLRQEIASLRAQNAQLRQLLTESTAEIRRLLKYCDYDSTVAAHINATLTMMESPHTLTVQPMIAEVAGQRVELTQQNLICSQCGQSWDSPACGPTHAAIKTERAQP